MNPIWYLAVAASLMVVGAGVLLVGDDEDSPAPPASTDAPAPQDPEPSSGDYDLLTTTSGSIGFVVLPGTEGTVSALVEPTADTARPERPICITLERDDGTVVKRAGPCGNNVVVQTSVHFGGRLLLTHDASALEPGAYRLGFQAEPQPATLFLAFAPA